MDEETDKPRIFLVENNFFHWFGEPFTVYCGETELIDFIGVNVLDAEVQEYRLVASTSKYLANIIRKTLDYDEDAKPERLILFNGGITIYSFGKIPRTELKGSYLLSSGNIWLAREPSEILRSENGLHNLIFGEEATEEGKVERIESIIRGYEQIEEDERRAMRKAQDGSFQSGRAQGEVDAVGYGL